MALGAFVWSAATLLSAVTHNYDELLLRHVIVGIGEATFVAISPAFLADLFPENIRGRVMGFFYLATPVGSALGSSLAAISAIVTAGAHRSWLSALPGFLLALGVLGCASRFAAPAITWPTASSAVRSGAASEQGVLDDYAGRSHDDLCHRWAAGLDADVSDAHPPRSPGPCEHRRLEE